MAMDLDLAVAADQKVEMFSGNGDGTFQYVWERTFPGMGNGVSIFAGDFNGDGILDLLTEDQYGDVYLLLGKGDGTFRHPGTAITSFPPSTCGLVTVNDFNGDGKLDLLMYCPGLEENQIVVLLGNGDGTFQQPVMSTVNPASPFTLAAGDFNSDGATDIIVSNAGTINQYQFSIFLGNGDGTFQPQQVVTLPRGYYGEGGMAVGDFNSDGLLDFLSVDAYYEGVIYLQQ
jgi:hypothetical protein